MSQIEEIIVNIFIPERVGSKPVLPFLEKQLNVNNEDLWRNRLFQKIDFPKFSKTIKVVSTIETADLVLFPHDFSFIRNEKGYIQEVVDFGKKNNKKIVLFFYSDSTEDLEINEEVLIIRASKYKHQLKSNELIMPAYVEDLLIDKNMSLRNKPAKPIIGFTGWAKCSRKFLYIKYVCKVVFYTWLGFFCNSFFLLRPGLFFRRRAISSIKKNKQCVADIHIRDNYSGNKKTISISPAIARKTFIENILNSDLSLVVKGDGNYSLRFFEVLSLGRIPLFVDTDCPLPLENVINYDDFIIRIDYKKVNKIANLAVSRFQEMNNDQFILMQKKAREAFENYLSVDSFLVFIFKKIKHEA